MNYLLNIVKYVIFNKEITWRSEMYRIVLFTIVYTCILINTAHSFENKICGEITNKNPLVTTEQRVNRQVNAYIPIPDNEFGYWASEEDFLSGEKGRDCEDYAMQKARELLRLGYDKKQLEIFIVEVRYNNRIKIHATLVVNKNCVLDSNYSDPYYIDKSNWIKILKRFPIVQLNAKGIF
jgi:predicted transglutaminase-like cysteine proteinase